MIYMLLVVIQEIAIVLCCGFSVFYFLKIIPSVSKLLDT